MSVAKTRHCTVHYGGLVDMIPWYRQVLALFLSLGVIMIALWGIDQSTGQYLVLGAMAMSFTTLLLIFGVEIEHINIEIANGWLTVHIPFTSTGDPNRETEDDDRDE